MTAGYRFHQLSHLDSRGRWLVQWVQCFGDCGVADRDHRLFYTVEDDNATTPPPYRGTCPVHGQWLAWSGPSCPSPPPHTSASGTPKDANETVEQALERVERRENRDPDRLNIGGALLDGFRAGFRFGWNERAVGAEPYPGGHTCGQTDERTAAQLRAEELERAIWRWQYDDPDGLAAAVLRELAEEIQARDGKRWGS